MDVPPSRYRVVERGRRLVVLDTHNGNAPVAPTPRALDALAKERPRALAAARRPGPSPADPRPRREAAARPIRSGAADPVLATQPWFDDKAPRRILLEDRKLGAMGLVVAVALTLVVIAIVSIGWPVLLVLGGLAFTPSVRKGLRRAVTRYLDDAGQEVGSGDSAG